MEALLHFIDTLLSGLGWRRNLLLIVTVATFFFTRHWYGVGVSLLASGSIFLVGTFWLFYLFIAQELARKAPDPEKRDAGKNDKSQYS